MLHSAIYDAITVYVEKHTHQWHKFAEKFFRIAHVSQNKTSNCARLQHSITSFLEVATKAYAHDIGNSLLPPLSHHDLSIVNRKCGIIKNIIRNTFRGTENSVNVSGSRFNELNL